jgi:hypothetical protein
MFKKWKEIKTQNGELKARSIIPLVLFIPSLVLRKQIKESGKIVASSTRISRKQLATVKANWKITGDGTIVLPVLEELCYTLPFFPKIPIECVKVD